MTAVTGPGVLADQLVEAAARAETRAAKASVVYAEHVLTLSAHDLRAHVARLGMRGLTKAPKADLYKHLGITDG